MHFETLNGNIQGQDGQHFVCISRNLLSPTTLYETLFHQCFLMIDFEYSERQITGRKYKTKGFGINLEKIHPSSLFPACLALEFTSITFEMLKSTTM